MRFRKIIAPVVLTATVAALGAIPKTAIASACGGDAGERIVFGQKDGVLFLTAGNFHLEKSEGGKYGVAYEGIDRCVHLEAEASEKTDRLFAEVRRVCGTVEERHFLADKSLRGVSDSVLKGSMIPKFCWTISEQYPSAIVGMQPNERLYVQINGLRMNAGEGVAAIPGNDEATHKKELFLYKKIFLRIVRDMCTPGAEVYTENLLTQPSNPQAIDQIEAKIGAGFIEFCDSTHQLYPSVPPSSAHGATVRASRDPS